MKRSQARRLRWLVSLAAVALIIWFGLRYLPDRGPDTRPAPDGSGRAPSPGSGGRAGAGEGPTTRRARPLHPATTPATRPSPVEPPIPKLPVGLRLYIRREMAMKGTMSIRSAISVKNQTFKNIRKDVSLRITS